MEARRLLADVVRFLHPSPRVRIEAPANVEAVITAPATCTLRVHFIACNPTPQTLPVKERPYVLPGLIEYALMFRATIKLKSATALNSSTELQKSGNRVTLRVVDIHEVVTLNY